jgi:hypothetical protein
MSGVTPPDALQFGPDGVLQWTQIAWDAALGGWLRPIDIVQRSRLRLAAQVEFARAHVPLYANRYRHLPPATRVARADLPPLSKAELMADLEASLSDRTLTAAAIDAFIADVGKVGTLLDGRYAVMTSSGSTGPPAIFLHDRTALATYQALELFRFRGAASPAHMAARLMAGERYAMVAATGGHFAGVTTIEHLRRSNPWLAAGMRVCSLLQPVTALVAELNAFAPTLLATYPTAAEMLADEADAGRLHLQLAELWLGGETLAPEVRARLAQSLGCRVRDAYGASEFMSIGWDCGHGSLHVNADWVLLEPVDAQIPAGRSRHRLAHRAADQPCQPCAAADPLRPRRLDHRAAAALRLRLGAAGDPCRRPARRHPALCRPRRPRGRRPAAGAHHRARRRGRAARFPARAARRRSARTAPARWGTAQRRPARARGADALLEGSGRLRREDRGRPARAVGLAAQRQAASRPEAGCLSC